MLDLILHKIIMIEIALNINDHDNDCDNDNDNFINVSVYSCNWLIISQLQL